MKIERRITQHWTRSGRDTESYHQAYSVIKAWAYCGTAPGSVKIVELKIDNPSSKDVTGTARTSATKKETNVAAAFYATLK